MASQPKGGEGGLALTSLKASNGLRFSDVLYASASLLSRGSMLASALSRSASTWRGVTRGAEGVEEGQGVVTGGGQRGAEGVRAW
eukprot:1186674-Prorocentrum_minimum.AAC.5